MAFPVLYSCFIQKVRQRLDQFFGPYQDYKKEIQNEFI